MRFTRIKMQSTLEKLDLYPVRLQSTPALARDAPRRHARERSAAIPERISEVPQHAAVGHVRDSRNSYFARLLRALHESRRIQAARTISRYRCLLQGGGEASQGDQPESSNGGELDMSSDHRSHLAPPQPSMPFNARTLTIIAVVGFGILHLIGGIIISRASDDRPAESSLAAIHGD
jgi:hypothetical protein